MDTLRIEAGRERSVLAHHPWVFSGSIATPDYEISPGSMVTIVDHKSRFLAYGMYNPNSTIRVRLLSWDQETLPDAYLITARLRDSIARRGALDLDSVTDAYRLVYSEADRLPGLIVDRYGDHVVMQILTAGMELFRETIVDTLTSELAPVSLYEKSIGPGRSREGLPERVELVAGGTIPELVGITEHGISYLVDIPQGHKTGFYLDQRDNRAVVSQYGDGARVLNCFAYTGGFGIVAAEAGAREVIHVDSSAGSLDIARQAVAGGSAEQVHSFIEQDVFQYLRQLSAEEQKFDLIVLDPPKLASKKSEINKAARAYKDMNRTAMQLLADGGKLATFSCSGAIDDKLFGQIVWEASVEAGIDMRVLNRLSQPGDHPVLLSFPEGQYLKGLLLERDDIPLH